MEQYNYKVLKHMNMNYKTVITHDLTLRFINISIQYTETIHSQNIFITDTNVDPGLWLGKDHPDI